MTTTAALFDSITWKQEDIDALVVKYAPNSHDIDVALQNMGIEIAALLSTLAALREENARLREGVSIALELAEWSRRYPRSEIFHAARQETIDGELIALEMRAKALSPPPSAGETHG